MASQGLAKASDVPRSRVGTAHVILTADPVVDLLQAQALLCREAFYAS